MGGHFSALNMYINLARRVEQLQWNFLWGGMGDDVKHHLVGWELGYSLHSKGEGRVRSEEFDSVQ